MISVRTHTKFRKAYKTRIQINQALDAQAAERIRLFQTNPHHPLLHDHPLKGRGIGKRAFSVSGDIRIIYRLLDQHTAEFLDIGTHNQVYQ